jgi:hypothetical protein
LRGRLTSEEEKKREKQLIGEKTERRSGPQTRKLRLIHEMRSCKVEKTKREKTQEKE